MTFRRILFPVALAVLFVSGAARAQFSAYAGVTGERLGSITCIDPQAKCAVTDQTVQPYGMNFGATYDLRTFGPVLLGVDVRGSVLHSNKSGYAYMAGTDLIRQYSVLGGLRGTFHTPYKVLRPYAQISAGLAHTNAFVPPPVFYQNATQVQGFAGLDLALFPILDFRAIELGQGAIFGGSGTHGVQSIGIGLVFHGPRN